MDASPIKCGLIVIFIETFLLDCLDLTLETLTTPALVHAHGFFRNGVAAMA